MPAKPKPALPNPAAVLPGEADILATVLENLADDTAKLVYADWLEERDDPRGPLLRAFVNAFRAGKKLPPVKGAAEPWCNLVGITLLANAHKVGLAPEVNHLLALARPAIAFNAVKAPEKSIPVGASKFGGRPDLPAGTGWPRFKSEPLSFLGQFNLAELAPSPVARELPATGVLSVFCLYVEGSGNDSFSEGEWQLLYFPDPVHLARTELDDDLAEGSRFPACRLEYTEALTLPHDDSPWHKELKVFGDTDIGSPYKDVYYSMCSGNHILGHPFPIQGDVCGGKKTTRHLLTIWGNDATGWEFGDGGALYFTLPEADLKAGRFDRVEMVMDCA